MRIHEYRPTGRESQALNAIKDDPDQELTVTEVADYIGASFTVVSQTLQNLELAGHVTRTENGSYAFVSDPTVF